MKRKPLHLGLHSGLPGYTSEAADRKQLGQMPKASEPSIATLLVQRSKKAQASPTSHNRPQD